MADPKRIRAARGTATAQDQRAGAPPVEPEVPKRDLDDVVVQAGIIDPQPTQVTIGGQPVLLHPLSAKNSRRLIELMRIVFARVRTVPGMVPLAMVRTITATLFEDEDLSFRFAGYVARATYPADHIPQIDLGAEQRRIDDVLTTDELPIVLDAMMILNRVMETIFAKK